MNVLDKLNDLAARTMSRHPCVDHGGCCVVAAHVAPRLAAIPGIKKVLIRSTNGKGQRDIDAVRKHLNNPLDIHEWCSNDFSFHRVWVEFTHRGKKYTYDSSNGVQIADKFKYDDCKNEGSFTVEEALAFANTDGGFWNSMFDRYEIPTLRQRISRFLNTLASAVA